MVHVDRSRDPRSGARVIAAVGSDGTRLVVWGLGRTAPAALRDADTQEGTPADLETHEITPRMAAAVRRGHVEWSSLRQAARTRSAVSSVCRAGHRATASRGNVS